MAIFCETLAESAVVAEACEAARMSISGAYAHRRRNPVFAAAWDAALTIARERLADTLLARSMEGNVEQIWRDGELVGERHVIDNRLGLAILRRLDRLAETGLSLHSSLQQPKPPTLVARSKPIDWELAINALQTGDDDAVCKALALVKADEVEEVYDPPNRPPSPDEPQDLDLSDRCWRTADGRWMTSFPPPAGFTGFEECDWDDPEEEYERECTPEEVAILEADVANARAAERAEEESLRDSWFALLRQESVSSPPLDGEDEVNASFPNDAGSLHGGVMSDIELDVAAHPLPTSPIEGEENLGAESPERASQDVRGTSETRNRERETVTTHPFRKEQGLDAAGGAGAAVEAKKKPRRGNGHE